MKLGCRRIYHKDKGQAAIRHYANLREPSFQALADIPPQCSSPGQISGGGTVGKKLTCQDAQQSFLELLGSWALNPGQQQQRAPAEDAT